MCILEMFFLHEIRRIILPTRFFLVVCCDLSLHLKAAELPLRLCGYQVLCLGFFTVFEQVG